MNTHRPFVLTALLLSAASANAALIAEWKLDEASGNVIDSTGNNPAGTPSAAGATYALGGVGNGTYGALSVTNASGSAIQLNNTYFTSGTGNTTAIQNLAPTDSFTVMGWVNLTAPDTSGAAYRLLSTGDAAGVGGGNGWGFGVKFNNTSGTGSSLIWTNYLVADKTSTSTFDLTFSTWNHIAATYSNGTINYYLNGASLGSQTNLFLNEGTGARLTLGNRLNGATSGANADQLKGLMDGVRVYDTALTLGEIQTAAVASISAIPEPSTYGLLGAGALGLVALVRRRRAR